MLSCVKLQYDMKLSGFLTSMLTVQTTLCDTWKSHHAAPFVLEWDSLLKQLSHFSGTYYTMQLIIYQLQ